MGTTALQGSRATCQQAFLNDLESVLCGVAGCWVLESVSSTNICVENFSPLEQACS